jgi:hypothetical protein
VKHAARQEVRMVTTENVVCRNWCLHEDISADTIDIAEIFADNATIFPDIADIFADIVDIFADTDICRHCRHF